MDYQSNRTQLERSSNPKPRNDTDNYLIDHMHGIRDIPAVIVQGRYDVVCPMMSAWDLRRAWPEAEWKTISDAGHAATEPGIVAALVDATDRFRGKLKEDEARQAPSRSSFATLSERKRNLTTLGARFYSALAIILLPLFCVGSLVCVLRSRATHRA